MTRRSFSNMWIDDGEPITWRHYVLGIFWGCTLVPELILVGLGVAFTWLGEALDGLYGRVKVWANPVRRGRSQRLRDDLRRT